jgi:hypothetical protein
MTGLSTQRYYERFPEILLFHPPGPEKVIDALIKRCPMNFLIAGANEYDCEERGVLHKPGQGWHYFVRF